MSTQENTTPAATGAEIMLQGAIGTLAAIDTALGIPEEGCNTPRATLERVQQVMALANAALDWSEERGPRDVGDAVLLKAVWTFSGPYEGPCEGCDGECDEPCATSCTVEEAHAAIDQSLTARNARLAQQDDRRSKRIADMVERLQARIAVLEQALQPLAAAFAEFNLGSYERMEHKFHAALDRNTVMPPSLVVGHCRGAWEALHGKAVGTAA